MLNELSQVVAALDAVGIVGASRHQNIQPMGKNDDILVVSLDESALPQLVEVVRAEIAQNLLKFSPANNGPSFPGLNLPTPLRTLESAPAEQLTPAIESLLDFGKNKSVSAATLQNAIARLYKLSAPRIFTRNQKDQFQRSCGDLVSKLREKLSNAPLGLSNFRQLLEIVHKAGPSISTFAELLAEKLVKGEPENDRYSLQIYQQALFGVLDWKKRAAEVCSPGYWSEKVKHDEKARQPIYFDLAVLDLELRVACRETGKFLNQALIKADATTTQGQTEGAILGVDAFSGDLLELQDKFPSPKVAELGPVKLFSLNTKEVRALQRYSLSGSEAFPVSSALAQKMNDAVLYLADEQKRGSTCCAIPAAQSGKRDLLIAYLEGAPEGREQLAEMFGGEAKLFSDPDFSAVAKPVIEMLEGKLTADAELSIQLVALSSLDPGRRQISLNRRFRVRDVIRAAKNWEMGARNVPDISIWFYDKFARQSVRRLHITPSPLELASTINRVWTREAEGGFNFKEQRAVSVVDAYDVFISDSPLVLQKVEAALGLLVGRMRNVLTVVAAIKNRRDWTNKNKAISDAVRWQSVKTIALFGILLHKLGQHRKDYVQESITLVGRLLALADSLHQQYCKHVRKGESPSQLFGNALFNTALDQPVVALARLAERLTPYQAWARTFQSDDPESGVGLVKYLLREIAACTTAIRLEALPQRMSDAGKAKLLLGYLADRPANGKAESINPDDVAPTHEH
jgi:hypothetical protein